MNGSQISVQPACREAREAERGQEPSCSGRVHRAEEVRQEGHGEEGRCRKAARQASPLIALAVVLGTVCGLVALTFAAFTASATQAPAAKPPAAMLTTGIDAASRMAPEALLMVQGNQYTYSGSCYWRNQTGYLGYTPRVAIWALNNGCWQAEAWIHYGANQPGCPAYTYTGWRLMGAAGNEIVFTGQNGCGATYVDIALYDSRGVEYAFYRNYF